MMLESEYAPKFGTILFAFSPVTLNPNNLLLNFDFLFLILLLRHIAKWLPYHFCQKYRRNFRRKFKSYLISPFDLNCKIILKFSISAKSIIVTCITNIFTKKFRTISHFSTTFAFCFHFTHCIAKVKFFPFRITSFIIFLPMCTSYHISITFKICST